MTSSLYWLGEVFARWSLETGVGRVYILTGEVDWGVGVDRLKVRLSGVTASLVDKTRFSLFTLYKQNLANPQRNIKLHCYKKW